MQQIEFTSKASIYAGATAGVFGWISLTEFLAIGGFIVALVSLVVNIWYKRQLLKIEYMKLERDKDADK